MYKGVNDLIQNCRFYLPSDKTDTANLEWSRHESIGEDQQTSEPDYI